MDTESTAFLGVYSAPKKVVDLGHMIQHSLLYNLIPSYEIVTNKVIIKSTDLADDIFNIRSV